MIWPKAHSDASFESINVFGIDLELSLGTGTRHYSLDPLINIDILPPASGKRHH